MRIINFTNAKWNYIIYGIIALVFIILLVISIDKIIDITSSRNSKAPELDDKDVPLDVDIESLYFSCNHMYQTECFSFYIGRESDGDNILFSVDFYTDEEVKIYLDNITIDPVYMDELNEISQKYEFGKMKAEKIDTGGIHIFDETTYRTSIYWENGQNRVLGHLGLGGNELEKFFINLAKQYSD